MNRLLILASALAISAMPLCAQNPQAGNQTPRQNTAAQAPRQQARQGVAQQVRPAQSRQNGIQPATQQQPRQNGAKPATQQQARPSDRKEVAPAKPRFKKVQYLSVDPRENTAPMEQNVMAIKDIVYAHRSDQDLHINIYKPSESSRSLPLVLYIQGSAWQKQNLTVKEQNLAKMASKGYVVAAVEYRSVTVAKMPAQARDAAEGLKYLKANAGYYGIDENNIFLWGGSSGGHTALLVGLSMVEGVNAVVDFFGPTDLLTQVPQEKLGTYLPGETLEERQSAAREYSPIYYITRNSPPVMIMHGDVDPVVPFDQSDNFAIKLAEKGVPVEFYCLNGAAHGSLHFWTDTVMGLIDEFFKEYTR